MLHLFHGTDRVRMGARLRAAIDSALAADPTRQVIELTPETWSMAALEEVLCAQSLFGEPPILVLRDLFEDEVSAMMLEGRLPEVAQSGLGIFVIGEELPVKLLAEIKKLGATVEEFRGTVSAGDESYKTVFAATDALGERDKKKLWVAYERSLLAGVSEEELFWGFVRQLKNMALVHEGATMNDLGTKSDYVYKKAVSAAKHFKKEELSRLHGELVVIWHDAHRGLLDFDTALERWALRI